MEFDEVIRRRRMVRGYDPDRPVPPDIVDKIVRHALRAPSAGFSQGWGFLVLTAAEDRARYWAATRLGDETDEWLARLSTAPLIIVALSNKAVYLDRYAQPDKGWTDRDEARWPVPYWHIDTGFAALLMHLTAVNEGLGSCFIRRNSPRSVRSPSATAPPTKGHHHCVGGIADWMMWCIMAGGPGNARSGTEGGVPS
jgi:nitroreductase